MSALQPNAEQLAALRAYAAANGRLWKSKLLHSWETGDAHGQWTAPLRQVRNNLGPSWLVRFKFPAVAAPAISGEAFAGKQPAHSPGPWIVDPVTFWRRDVKGREIFRPFGISIADAKLVDVAPEMAELLQKIRQHEGGLSDDACDMIAAVLAKAGL